MRTRKRPGQTLIEVTMATMIAAITTTAVFSVVLSSYVSNVKADKRDAAAMALRRAQDTLKSYISTLPGDALYSPTTTSGVGRWPADSSGMLALSAGNHNISSLVSGPPLTPSGGPAATFSYTVANVNCLSLPPGPLLTDANQCKTVFFTLGYAD